VVAIYILSIADQVSYDFKAEARRLLAARTWRGSAGSQRERLLPFRAADKPTHTRADSL